MKRLVIILNLFLIFCRLIAQTDGKNLIEVEKQYYKADQLLEQENYDAALLLFEPLYQIDSTNVELNMKLGLCYLYSSIDKKLAFRYFENAEYYLKYPLVKNGKAKINSYKAMLNDSLLLNQVMFYKARALRLDYQMDNAIILLDFLEKKVPVSDVVFIENIKNEKNSCIMAKEMMKNPVKILAENLGSTINSKYSDHSPVFSLDESVLIFCSRRPRATDEVPDIDGQFDEDIYISHKDENGNWGKPTNISDNINSIKYEATINLSADGQQLFLYKDDKKDGNIYVSYLQGNEWTIPVKLPEPINTKNRETHASSSLDGNSIYFTSNRKGGFGGLDIYVVRKLPNGTWGKPENLGPNVNTSKDEEGPYLHPDGKTLYFSSNGHPGMGGYDVFYSTFENETSWSAPVNLGYPINTPDNDVFYTPTADGTRAYYASQTKDGFGKSDICVLTLIEAKEKAIAIVSGYFENIDEKKGDVKITVFGSKDENIFGIYRPNNRTGKYLFVLNRIGNYIVEYEADGKIIDTEEINLNYETPFKEINRKITIPSDNIKSKANEDISNDKLLKNIQNMKDSIANQGNTKVVEEIQKSGASHAKLKICTINFDKGESIENQKVAMDRIVSFLTAYPNSVIGIYGQTRKMDNIDSEKAISEKNANLVNDFLLKKGCNQSQIVVKALGNKELPEENTNGDDNRSSQIENSTKVVILLLEQGNGNLDLLLGNKDKEPDN